MKRFWKTRLTITAVLVLHLKANVAAADVVAVVAADNPVDSLSRIELINIFLGKSSHFPDGTPALPIDLQENAAVREAFYTLYAGKSATQIRAYWSKMIFTGRGRPPRTVKSGEEVRQWVATNSNAIGYLDEGLVDDRLKIVDVR